jgi:hypothetical protein
MLLYHQNKKLDVQINFSSSVQVRIVRSSTISRASSACFPVPLGFEALSFELLSMPHCIKLTLAAASLLRH